MTRNCSKCNTSFEFTEADHAFLEKVSPKCDGKTLLIPEPEKCPDCRMQQKMNFRNERHLYRRKSSLSGNGIISIYHESSPHRVFHPDEWWGDNWNGTDFEKDFDFSRPFFEQFKELLIAVPRIGLFNVNPTNSEFCQQAYNNKNCYLCTVITECEDCMYISHANKDTDCFDCDYVQNCQLCFGCLDSDKLYNCADCQSCQNSSDLTFCYDCIGCDNCFGCFGLRKKQFQIFNTQYSKEDYFKQLEELGKNKFSKFDLYRKKFQEALVDAPQRESWSLNTVDCVGNYLINAKNCQMCFDSFEIQDCKNCTWIFESHDIHDVYGLGKSDWLYDCLGNENAHTGAFNTFVSDSNDMYYSDCCFYSSNLFGCAGLRNKKFHILNKEYTPEEYDQMIPKIVEHMKKHGEWGKFPPVELSPFGYDESVANENFPLTKDDAEKAGFIWTGHVEQRPSATKVVPAKDIPDDITDVTDEILDWAIECETSTKLFKIQEKELKFYRTAKLPIPRKHPDERYKKRMNKRNSRKIHERECLECKTKILTTFDPTRPEKVFCEKCYLAKLY
jgi:hypothetical protein